MKRLLILIQRELSVVFSSQSEFIYPLAFFFMVTALFPLGVTPEAQSLALIAPGVIWIAALLSILLSLNAFYQSDFEQGNYEQILLCGVSGYTLCFAKVAANWLVTALPLVIVMPLIGLMFGLSFEVSVIAMLTLLLGTPSLCFIGAIGMNLTLGLPNSGVLLTLLILPLDIPVLIFGSSAVVAASMGEPYNAQLAILAALLLLSSWLAPYAASAAMKISLD